MSAPGLRPLRALWVPPRGGRERAADSRKHGAGSRTRFAKKPGPKFRVLFDSACASPGQGTRLCAGAGSVAGGGPQGQSKGMSAWRGLLWVTAWFCASCKTNRTGHTKVYIILYVNKKFTENSNNTLHWSSPVRRGCIHRHGLAPPEGNAALTRTS